MRVTVKNAKHGEAVFAVLMRALTQRVGERQAQHLDRMFRTGHGMSLKEGGKAWWSWRCTSIARDIVSADSRVKHFIPPSPETLAWGGFLGGEHVSYTNKAEEALTEAMLRDMIAQIE